MYNTYFFLKRHFTPLVLKASQSKSKIFVGVSSIDAVTAGLFYYEAADMNVTSLSFIFHPCLMLQYPQTGFWYSLPST